MGLEGSPRPLVLLPSALQTGGLSPAFRYSSRGPERLKDLTGATGGGGGEGWAAYSALGPLLAQGLLLHRLAAALALG